MPEGPVEVEPIGPALARQAMEHTPERRTRLVNLVVDPPMRGRDGRQAATDERRGEIVGIGRARIGDANPPELEAPLGRAATDAGNCHADATTKCQEKQIREEIVAQELVACLGLGERGNRTPVVLKPVDIGV